MCSDFGRYINPFTDFGFKKIFGEENSKPQLISFLNAFLELEKKDKIVDLEFKNLEKLGLNIIDRKAIFDIYCLDESGFTLTFAFVEMPKFNKKESELVTYLDKWFYFLKNLDSLNDIPLIYKDEKVIIDAFKKAEYLNLPKEDKDSYFYSLKVYRDLHNVIDTAESEGIKKGIEIGIEKGIELGVEKGKLEGKLEGEKQKAIEIAKKMLKKDSSVEDVAEITGLSIDEIEKIQ